MNEVLGDLDLDLEVTKTTRKFGASLRATFFAKPTIVKLGGNKAADASHVVHILPAKDVTKLSGSSDFLVKQEFKAVRIAGIDEQMVVAVRAKMPLLSNSRATHSPLERRVEILQDVLRGLDALHSAGKSVRGKLDRTNVGLAKDGRGRILDYEIAESGSSEYRFRPEKDIREFAYLAWRVLGDGNEIWDGRYYLPEGSGLDTEAFEWILDFCTKSNLAPAAGHLIDALNAVTHESRFHAASGLFRLTETEILGAREDLATAARKSGTGPPLDTRIVTAAHWTLASKLHTFPETRLAFLNRQTAKNLFEWNSIAPVGDFNYSSNITEDKFDGFLSASAIDKTLLSEGIDLTWRNSIHHSHFGTSLDVEHEERMSKAESEGDALPGREEFLAHVTAMGLVRQSLLAQDDFLYGDAVLQLMRFGGLDVGVDEILVLRRWGDLLSVPDHGRWLYPSFQFDRKSGRPSKLVAEAALALSFDDSWEALNFWFVARPFLEGRRLADVVHRRIGEEAVLRAVANYLP